MLLCLARKEGGWPTHRALFGCRSLRFLKRAGFDLPFGPLTIVAVLRATFFDRDSLLPPMRWTKFILGDGR